VDEAVQHLGRVLKKLLGVCGAGGCGGLWDCSLGVEKVLDLAFDKASRLGPPLLPSKSTKQLCHLLLWECPAFPNTHT
jgi:hypothetical protein